MEAGNKRQRGPLGRKAWGGTPVDAGIHRARKESVCVRAQPVVQARRWRAFVCLWPRECVAQP